jgi:phenylalanine-4-hydroxylase
MQAEQLESDSHPAFTDSRYRARREHIAALAARPSICDVEYTADEHAVWRLVRARLDPLHELHACRAVREAQHALPLPTDAIPQLADVSRRLQRLSQFRLCAVAGLVAPRPFFAALADGVFLATQYVRHCSAPFYTPEPDVIHELVGHVAMLADERIAALARAFGRLARAADEALLTRVQRVFWFGLEFGMCREHGAARAVGAGLLSSAGELDHAMNAADRDVWRAWDLDAMATTDYATTDYQRALFVAPSFRTMVDDLGAWIREQARSSRGGRVVT